MGISRWKCDCFDSATPISGYSYLFNTGDFGSSYSYSHSDDGPSGPACVQDCSPDACLADESGTSLMCLDDCSFPDMQALCSPQMMPMLCQFNGYDPAPITQMCSAILSPSFSYRQRPTYSTHKGK